MNFILSSVAIVVSIIAICTSLNGFSLSETAYLGWAVAALSTLVVVLITWNIYNVIDIRNIRKDVEEILQKSLKDARDGINDEIGKKISDVYKEIDSRSFDMQASIYSKHAYDSYITKRYNIALNFEFLAISQYLMLKNKHADIDCSADINEELKNIREIIKGATDSKHNFKVVRYKDEWLSVLSQLNDYGVNDVLIFVCNL